MKLPRLPTSRIIVLYDLLKEILDYLRATRITSVEGGKLRSSPSGTTLYIDRVASSSSRAILPPYWVRLQTTPAEGMDPETYTVTVTEGYVQEYLTGTGDALAYHKADNHYTETDPPTDPVTYTDTLAAFDIAVDEAVYVVIQLDEDGRINSGSDANPITIEIAADNEASTMYQPKVDDETPDGTSGTLKVKLTRLVDDGGVKLRHVMAGKHIQYAPPLPSIKSTTAAGTGVGVIPKGWDNANNCYKVRAIIDGDGIIVTQNADTIEVKADTGYDFPTLFPWKVTNAGSGNAAVAAGFIHGYFLTYADASRNNPPSGGYIDGYTYYPDKIVAGPSGVYAGGSVAITGTQYIYAEIDVNNDGTTPNEYAESFDDPGASQELLVELSDMMGPTLLQTATIVVSSSAADAYTPTTGKASKCIAKVTNAAGVITVDEQYVTHNFDMFLPRVLVTSFTP